MIGFSNEITLLNIKLEKVTRKYQDAIKEIERLRAERDAARAERDILVAQLRTASQALRNLRFY